jgi:hypothetical protein
MFMFRHFCTESQYSNSKTSPFSALGGNYSTAFLTDWNVSSGKEKDVENRRIAGKCLGVSLNILDDLRKSEENIIYFNF